MFQTVQYAFVVLVTAVLLGFSTSCSNDDDDDAPARNAHKIVFKAESSAGSNIDIAVYGYDTSVTTASNLSGTAWTSPEITAPAGAINANVTVNGIGTSTSVLKVKIYVDGELKKEGTSSGQVLSASANYIF